MESDLIKLPRGLEIAREMSKKSTEPFLLGSCFTNSGKILSRGYNRYRGTNALVNKYFGFHTIHAEMDAIFRAPRALWRGGIIYVYRTRRDGTSAISKPCIRCQRALKDLGIKKAVYSIEYFPYFQEMKFQ
jgi:deoxycytidylate deaminase